MSRPELRSTRTITLGNAGDGFQYAKAAYLAGVSTSERGWHAPHVDDQADMDSVTALTAMYLDRTDVPERPVSNAVGRWNDSHDRRQAVLGRIILAQFHVQAGDSRGSGAGGSGHQRSARASVHTSP